MKFPLAFFAALFLIACNSASDKNNAQKNSAGNWTPPSIGTVVAADSMRFAEDALNNFFFAIKLTVSSDNANAMGDYGFLYDLSTHCGPGEMTGRIAMPPGGKNLQPLLRRAPEGGYKYIIGFIAGKDLGGDGRTFQEMYAITGSKEKVEITPLKNYRFQ